MPEQSIDVGTVFQRPMTSREHPASGLSAIIADAKAMPETTHDQAATLTVEEIRGTRHLVLESVPPETVETLLADIEERAHSTRFDASELLRAALVAYKEDARLDLNRFCIEHPDRPSPELCRKFINMLVATLGIPVPPATLQQLLHEEIVGARQPEPDAMNTAK